MVDREMSRRWGNPCAAAFRKQHIRTVEVGGCTVLVNRQLTGIVAGLLTSAHAHNIRLGTSLGAYQSVGEEPPTALNYGIAIRTTQLRELGRAFGFVQHSRLLVFEGDLEEARTAAADAEHLAVLARVRQENPAQGGYKTVRPGHREVWPGDRGSDVYFYQLLVAAPDMSGVFDEWCTAMASYKQRKYGLPITGTISPELWAGLLPNHKRGIVTEYGDTGIPVTVLQSALKAYDWGGNDLEITGRFDKATTRAVNNLQETYGLRVHPGAGKPEWAALMGANITNG